MDARPGIRVGGERLRPPMPGMPETRLPMVGRRHRLGRHRRRREDQRHRRRGRAHLPRSRLARPARLEDPRTRQGQGLPDHERHDRHAPAHRHLPYRTAGHPHRHGRHIQNRKLAVRPVLRRVERPVQDAARIRTAAAHHRSAERRDSRRAADHGRRRPHRLRPHRLRCDPRLASDQPPDLPRQGRTQGQDRRPLVRRPERHAQPHADHQRRGRAHKRLRAQQRRRRRTRDQRQDKAPGAARYGQHRRGCGIRRHRPRRGRHRDRPRQHHRHQGHRRNHQKKSSKSKTASRP